MHVDLARLNLARKGTVGTEEKLLPGLTSCVEGTRDLCTTERTVGKVAAVFAREGHALRDTLVDDVGADLCEPIDVGLTRAEVTPLNGVVEESINAVTVVLVVFGRVDTALGRNLVSASRRVLVAETVYVVAKLSHGCTCGRTGESRTDDDDTKLPLVGWVDQLHFKSVLVPLLSDIATWNFGFELHDVSLALYAFDESA